MGQKTNPIGFRLPVRRNWESRWYAGKKDFPALLKEDFVIRRMLREKLKAAAVPRIFIERASNRIRVKIFTARPGVVIGKKGQELDKIREELQKVTGKEVLLDIHEVKKPDLVAYIVAEGIALQLERRISFRRALKQAIGRTMKLGAKGIKTQVSGRLGGADIARTEHYHEGTIPLQTIRADIDYGFAEAKTTYGRVGVKVWIYRGEVLHDNANRRPRREGGAR